MKSDTKGATFGPYENVAASASQDVTLHFTTASPFLTTTELFREIEGSHWGNVAVTEDVSLKHSGAELIVRVWGEGGMCVKGMCIYSPTSLGVCM